MAEAVLRHHLTHHPSPSTPRITHIDSCGTSAYHLASPPDPRTLSVLAAHDITAYTHAARKLSPEDFRRFDYIFGMDAENVEELERVRRRVVRKGIVREEEAGRVELFGKWGRVDGEGEGEEVGDPYYGRAVFEEFSELVGEEGGERGGWGAGA
ncbi:Low molecular weight phosphotyrosine protein phosphatase [Elasticomyces elasticus]|nr:Low molecular weight phosphotyrosine protein phosphatase [Elasticomyces elasticus]